MITTNRLRDFFILSFYFLCTQHLNYYWSFLASHSSAATSLLSNSLCTSCSFVLRCDHLVTKSTTATQRAQRLFHILHPLTHIRQCRQTVPRLIQIEITHRTIIIDPVKIDPAFRKIIVG